MKRSGFALFAMLSVAPALVAQGPPGDGRGRQGGPPPTPRAEAPLDLSGQWVSVITEDWRWRMTTPQKGDFASVPLNAEGRKVADAWDLAKDAAAGEQCRPFGAPSIMRMPTRVRISWDGDAALTLETDAGQQTRVFRFASPGSNPKVGAVLSDRPGRTWQGVSIAEWNKQSISRGLGFGGSRGVAGGNLKVTTTELRAGYLRKNGVPYSESAVVTEYYNRHDEPNGDSWFTVTTIVDDPRYLTQPFITSSHFKRETDTSKWNPTPCQTDPPR